MNETDSDRLLDRALEAVRGDVPGAPEETAALDRVANRIETASGVIDDYRVLVADYLADSLSPARKLLFEEELNNSVRLRRAVRAAEHSARRSDPAPRRAQRRWPWAAAAAAAAAVVLALGVLLIVRALPVADQSRLAQVDPSGGVLYHVAEEGLTRLPAGAWVTGNERLRTGKTGSTLLVLDDGSRLEIEARSQLRLRRQRSGNHVHVDRGRVIVQAAAQGDRTLEVATDDLLVAVRGTVFGVSHGVNGTRVAVVEGEVEVRRGTDRTSLRAGEQLDTRGLAATSVAEDVAWSRDAERYVEMLAEFAEIKRDLGALLSVTPRHSPRLLDLVPDDTGAYVAIPNAADKIAEGYRLLLGRVVEAEMSAVVERYVDWLDELGDYLGDETVLAVRVDNAAPVVLAEVLREGLSGALKANLPDLVSDLDLPDGRAIELVDSPEQANDGALSLWLTDDLLVASTDPQALANVNALLGGADHAFAKGELYARLKEAYTRGAYYLAGVDLDRFNPPSGGATPMAKRAETLILEGRADGERAQITAEIRFKSIVPDVLTWLDTPGPIGALEFFSPDAQIAGAALLGNAADFVERFKRSSDAGELSQIGGVDFLDDWMVAAGGEVAFGLDGPVLPTPSWRAVIEVYDKAAFQEGIETAVRRANEAVGLRGGGTEATLVAQSNARYPSYELRFRGFSAHYAYFDGYLVAAASAALVDQAKRIYDSDVTLLSSSDFRDLLPRDRQPGFSAVGYTQFADLASAAWELVSKDVPEPQRKIILDVLADAGPGLYAVYRERDRVRVVVNGPLGLSLPELAILAGMAANTMRGSGGT